MIPVLIVDDEQIIREGLARLIRDKCPQYEVVAEAADGASALEITRKLHPRVALVDIRMQGMDGIEYIHLAAKEADAPRFIVLSGYAEFEYARRLIGVGCEGYLLKPLKHAELVGLMAQIARKLENEAQQAPNAADIENERAEILRRLVSGQPVPEETICGAGLDALLGAYWEALISPDCAAEPVAAAALRQALKKAALPQGVHGQMMELEEDAAAVLLYAEKGKSLTRSQAAAAIRHFRNCAETVPGLSATVGVSLPQFGAAFLATAHRQCVHAAERRFYAGGGKTFFYESDDHLNAWPDTAKREQALLAALDIGDPEEIVRQLDGLLDRLAADQVQKKAVVIVLSKLYVEIVNVLEKQDRHALVNSLPDYALFEAALSRMRLFSDMRREMEKIAAVILRSLPETPGGNRAVALARRYVQLHMDQPIGLMDAARAVGMNPSYFSMLFKRETGKNFTNYVNRTKIEYAKQLLRQPVCKVYQVCRQVGFEDAKYFARLFHRIVGVTPSDYREGKVAKREE